MKSNIRKLRNDREITQAELARVIGRTQQAVSQMEQDREHISIESLIIMADYFGVSTDYILGLTEERNDPPLPAQPAPDDDQMQEVVEKFKDLLENSDDRLLYELILSLIVCGLKGQES